MTRGPAPARPAAGYSGTPLVRKLGIKPGTCLLVLGAPPTYWDALGPLPDSVRRGGRSSDPPALVHLFTRSRAALARALPSLVRRIAPDGAIWVSWPKRASGVATDVTEDVIRALALPLGLVDVKVCAVDEVWSGLRLVIRLANRPR